MDEDRDGVGLGAVGATGAPDTKLPGVRVPREARGQHHVAQRVEVLGLTEEERLAHGQLGDERVEFRLAGAFALQEIEIVRERFDARQRKALAHLVENCGVPRRQMNVTRRVDEERHQLSGAALGRQRGRDARKQGHALPAREPLGGPPGAAAASRDGPRRWRAPRSRAALCSTAHKPCLRRCSRARSRTR